MNRVLLPALLVLLAAPAGLAQDFVHWLPEKTVGYLSIEDSARLRERIGKSAFHAMWNDPAMKPLREMIEKEMEKEATGKASPKEFLDLLHGQVCVAGVPVGANKTAGVVLIDLKEKRRELLDLMKRLEEDNEDDVRREEEDFHGYTLETIRRLVEGEEEPSVDYQFVKDDLFGWSDDLDVLKDLITRREAGDETGLSGWEPHRKVVAATAARPDVRWYLSSSLWLREFGAMAAPFLAAAGMEKVRAVGGQLSIRERGIHSEIVIQNEGEPRGVMRLLGGNIENLGPPAMLPPDVDPAFTIAIDWQFVHSEAMRLLKMFQPDAVGMVEGMIGQVEQQLGMRLEQDVLAALAPGLSYAFLPIPEAELAKAPKGVEFADFAAQFIVFFQKLRNAETIQRLLAKMTAEDGSPYNEVVYLGTKLYESEDKSLPVFAVIGDQLTIAFRSDSLRALVQRQGKELKSFRDTDAYKRALSLVPAKRSLLMVSNPEGSSGSSLFWTGVMEGLKTAPAGNEFAKAVPPIEFIEKYQDVSTFSMATVEQGLVINWFLGVKAPSTDD